jgi:outer membrane receptor for ferrienterochelin and colicin
VGSSVNYAYNGINLQLGGAFQALKLDGKSEIRPPAIDTQSFNYKNFIPYFSVNFDLPKTVYLSASYSYEVTEPDISNLFPMPNLSNTLYKTMGNPNLDPERSHRINGYLSYWNSASMVNFSLSGYANFYDNQIVYNQNTEYIANQGYVTISKPENVKGGNRVYSHFWTNFPIVKTKLTMSVSANGSISNSPVFINQQENNTNSKNYGGSLSLNLTINQKLSFYASGSVSQTFTAYSIQSDRDQQYMNYGASLSGKWQVFKKTFLESSYRFSNYANKKLDFNRNLNNLNVSVRQVIGEKNQWELRLAAVDLLNQNQYISQIAAVNYIEYRTSPTLARYFLLTGAYNIKGFETKNNNRRGYF